MLRASNGARVMRVMRETLVYITNFGTSRRTFEDRLQLDSPSSLSLSLFTSLIITRAVHRVAMLQYSFIRRAFSVESSGCLFSAAESAAARGDVLTGARLLRRAGTADTASAVPSLRAWGAVSAAARAAAESRAQDLHSRAGGRARDALRAEMREPCAASAGGGALVTAFAEWVRSDARPPPADVSRIGADLLRALMPRAELLAHALGARLARASAAASLRVADADVELPGGRRLLDVKRTRMERRARAIDALAGATDTAGGAEKMRDVDYGGTEATVAALADDGTAKTRPRAALSGAPSRLTLALASHMRARFAKLPFYDRASLARVGAASLESAGARSVRTAAAAIASLAPASHEVLPVAERASRAALAGRVLQLAITTGAPATLAHVAGRLAAARAPVAAGGIVSLLKASARARRVEEEAAVRASAPPSQLTPSTAPTKRVDFAAPLALAGVTLPAAQWRSLLLGFAHLAQQPREALWDFLAPPGAHAPPFVSAGSGQEGPARLDVATTVAALLRGPSPPTGGALWGALHRVLGPIALAAAEGGDVSYALAAVDALSDGLATAEREGALEPARARVDATLIASLAEALARGGEPTRAQKLLDWCARSSTGSNALTRNASAERAAARARDAVVVGFAQEGRLDDASAALAAARTAAALNPSIRVGARAAAALVGAAAAANDVPRALTELRAAQLRGTLRHVDAGLYVGRLSTGGLPAAALSAVVPDALRALRRAVVNGHVPPPPALCIFHAPAHRHILRGILSAEGLLAEAIGRRASERCLVVRGGEWLAFLSDEHGGADTDALHRDVALVVDDALKDGERPNARGAIKYKAAAIRVLMSSDVPPVAAHLL